MSRKTGLVIVLLGALAAAGLGGFWLLQHGNADPTAAATDATAGTASSTPRAPTPMTSVPPLTPGAQIATDPAPVTTGGAVKVIATYVGWEQPPGVSSVDGQRGTVRARAYVSGVVESGGTCAVELTGADGTVVTARAQGMPDASTTLCGLDVDDARLSPGTWQAVLSYRSATSVGASNPVAVEVTAR
jgi:hypothetical protein